MSSELILTCAALGSQFRYGPSGGTFGRSKKCDWVLPDPNRILSSIHARVVFQGGAFLLIDESTNGTFLAGQEQPIGRGRSIPLGPGTVLTAGPYEITAELVAAQQPMQSAPVAVAQSPVQPAAAVEPQPDFTPDAQFLAPGQTYGAPPKGKQSLDPLDYLGGSDPAPQPVSAAPQASTQQIPQDFMQAGAQAPTAVPPAAQVLPQATAAPVAQPVQPVAASVPPQPVASPPAEPAQQQPSATPAPAATPPASGGIPDDFWSSLPGGALPGSPTAQGAAPVPSQPAAPQPPAQSTIPDDFSFGAQQASSAPSPVSTQEAAQPASTSASLPPMPQSAGLNAPVSSMMPPMPGPGTAGGLSHLDALKARREQRVAALDAKAKGADKDEARLAGAPQPLPAAAQQPQMPAQAMPPQPMPVSSASQETQATASVQEVSNIPMPTGPRNDEDLQILLRAMGFPEAEVPEAIRDQILQDVGAMVREMASGLVSMMAARKVVKSEFRIDETRIEPKENNPFKYFKVGELALDEMLLTRTDGYLSPAQATRHAFQDLQSHSMVIMSAMQRAMRLMFEKLSPEALAQAGDGDGALRLRSLGGRRDKWDTARSTYDHMRKDYEAVVRQMIMEAFTQVQEEQARRMSDDYWNKRKK
ncbi:type VI secretion system-associated FHA domain protein TagH [Roseibium sp.]|uniref:type VI secretion system-associated FHA domain protein TagH n=1 Tax=Roseibium sp. TaxID=1936156 RepID=UPI003B510438